MRCGCCEGLVGQGSTKCESNSGGPSFAAKQQLSVFEGVREMMRRLIRKGEEGPPESIPPPFFLNFSHSFDSGGRTCTSLSLSLTLLILYTYINNCLHVQYLPLDEKRTSVVTVGMQVLRTFANQLATPSCLLLEYIFFPKVAKEKLN